MLFLLIRLGSNSFQKNVKKLKLRPIQFEIGQCLGKMLKTLLKGNNAQFQEMLQK